MTDSATHWQHVYTDKQPEQVSWYEAVPERSIELIEATGVNRDAAILDIGGGTSTLAAELRDAGYQDVTVADISKAALDESSARLGTRAEGVDFIVADVRDHDFGRPFALWHDRALFHFMVEPEDRAAYLRTLRRTLELGGYAVIATFGPQGPTQCSGLPVTRYADSELADVLGPEFAVTRTETGIHTTPSGNAQQFLYLVARRD